MKTTLVDLAIMDLQQMRQWVALTTKGKHFIPNYAGYEAKSTAEYGLLSVQNNILMAAIKGVHGRLDSRSLTIVNAAQKGDCFTIAATLVSAHRTYMTNRGFTSKNPKNTQKNLAICAKIKEEERAQAKADMIALQLNTIGAILGAKKAKKVGAIQGFWDFEESSLLVNSEGYEFGDLTPAAIA